MLTSIARGSGRLASVARGSALGTRGMAAMSLNSFANIDPETLSSTNPHKVQNFGKLGSQPAEYCLRFFTDVWRVGSWRRMGGHC